MAKQTGRTKTLTVRISPDRLAAASLVALATGRTVSSLAEHCIELYIRKNYPQAFTPGARVVTKIEEAPELSAPGRIATGDRVVGNATPYLSGVFTPQPAVGPGCLVGGHALPYTRPVFEAP